MAHFSKCEYAPFRTKTRPICTAGYNMTNKSINHRFSGSTVTSQRPKVIIFPSADNRTRVPTSQL